MYHFFYHTKCIMYLHHVFHGSLRSRTAATKATAALRGLQQAIAIWNPVLKGNPAPAGADFKTTMDEIKKIETTTKNVETMYELACME
jgi:hypothetical protein